MACRSGVGWDSSHNPHYPGDRLSSPSTEVTVMPTAFPPVDEQLKLLLRGAAQVETKAELAKKLEKSRSTGTPLRVKYGIDPTGFDVHLGHTVPLRKLRQFQQLGHTAVLLIGTA